MKIGRKIPPLGDNGTLPGGTPITTTMDLTLIERGNLRQSVIGPIIRGMILTKNLVQNLQ